MNGRQSCVMWWIVAAGVAIAAAQGPTPEVRKRVDAFVEALASGDAARFEAMAQEQYAPALLARRTSEDRKVFVERIRSELGRLTLERVERDAGGPILLVLRGSTGAQARVEMTLEVEPPARIDGLSVRITDGGEPERPADTQPPPDIRGSMSPAEMTRGLDAYLAPRVADDRFSGVVMIGKAGTPLVQRAYGLADREKRVPVKTTTRFSLASIGKAFTRAAIGQLITAGRITPEDTVGKLLRDYPNPEALGATVDQLLNHQAGITDFFGPAFDAAPKGDFRSNADYYRFVATRPLLFAPGTKRQYCNGCYIVLGAIVERVSGMRYEDYVAAHVFGPAGMTGAGFPQSDNLPPDTALGYTRRGSGGDGALRSSAQLHGAAGSAAGGGFATAADLVAFDNALRDGRLLGEKGTSWFFGGAQAGGGRRMQPYVVAGGSAGVNTVLQSDGTWVVVVLTNLDPPAAEPVAEAILRQLAR